MEFIAIFTLFTVASLNQAENLKLSTEKCDLELSNFSMCMDSVKDARNGGYFAVPDGREFSAIQGKRGCFEEYGCPKPTIINKGLRIGINCLKSVTEKMKYYVSKCLMEKIGSRLLASSIRFPPNAGDGQSEYDPFSEGWLVGDLRKDALQIHPQPENLRQLAAALKQPAVQTNFDPFERISEALFNQELCHTSRAELIVECFLNKSNKVADPLTYHLNTIHYQKEFCRGRQSCLEHSISPACHPLFLQHKELSCQCAKDVLGWLELEEHQDKWNAIFKIMTDCNSNLDKEDLKKAVIKPLLERFHCTGPLRNPCSPEMMQIAHTPISKLWPYGEILEVSASVRGIQLDGNLPIGKK